MNKQTDYKAARMCPRCGEDSVVYDSREQDDGSILRRRQCMRCGAKFVTVETFKKIAEENVKFL